MALSFTRAHSSSAINTQMDLDFSMLMDTSHDFEHCSDGVVRWVASQSPNPALQALMKEAEREKKTRPSTPVHESTSWTYPLASTSSSTSLSSSVTSPWQSSGHNSADVSYLLPLSGGGASSSLAHSASDPVSRRAKPLSTAQRKPLASSTSSANQPIRESVRARSSSHSNARSNLSASKKYIPQEEEPEAMAFIELLKDVSRQLDQNSEKKQRLVAWTKEKERERSLAGSPTGLDSKKLNACTLTKTSSASAIYPRGASTRLGERTSATALSTSKYESRGRVLAKTASLGASDVDPVSEKSNPASLPNTILNRDLPQPPARTPSAPSAARKATAPERSPDGDSAMQDVDLTETDTEWERPTSGLLSRATTATYMQIDSDDGYTDTAMDVSFIHEPPPQLKPKSKPKSKPKPTPQSQPTNPCTTSRLPAPTQRARAGPPLLGMRRASQLQPSQYSASQGTKGVSVPRFKPPLLANGETSKCGNGSGGGSEARSATTTNTKLPARGAAARMPPAKMAARASQDADSSFDVSFGVDADVLEEAMKAYD